MDPKPTTTVAWSSSQTPTSSSSSSSTTTSSLVWRQEAHQLLNLAIPSAIVQVGAFLPSTWTASFVGRHLGTDALAGFSLASLTVNLCTLSILNGLYSASDTLSPQAFGSGNYREVGLLAMRGLAASLVITTFINALLFFKMEHILLAIGEKSVPSELATQWYRVYVFVVPMFALYSVQWKFLSSQDIMKPLVVVSLLAVFVVLPVSLQLLVPWIGFIGSAYAFLAFQSAQALGLLVYLLLTKRFTPGTWPGLSYWKEAVLQWKPLCHYLYLGFGGIVASSEWIWWECVSLVIGTLGVVEQSTHAIPTQVLVTSFMLPYGIGLGLAIRIGTLLPTHPGRARQLAFGCCSVSLVLFSILSCLMYAGKDWICQAFTSDPQVLDAAESIWLDVVVSYFNFCFLGVFTGIAFGLGMQWTLGIATAICMWLFSFPLIYYHAIVRGGGLQAAWTWIYPPYLAINGILAVAFVRADWDAIGLRIRQRLEVSHPHSNTSSGSGGATASEETPLFLEQQTAVAHALCPCDEEGAIS